jgi:hypothetical protein
MVFILWSFFNGHHGSGWWLCSVCVEGKNKLSISMVAIVNGCVLREVYTEGKEKVEHQELLPQLP